jgi:hypothetical protein
MFHSKSVLSFLVCLITLTFNFSTEASAQSTGSTTYAQINSFTLTKGVSVNGHTFTNDRAAITLSGTLYVSEPINGKLTGAVFIGTGKFSVPVPESSFEKANVRRLLKTDIIETDFDTAVIRMTDGSLDAIGGQVQPMAIPAAAQKLASEHGARIRKDTGTNISARLAASLLNGEAAGIFFATFRGGKMGEVSYLFDPTTRMPTMNFGLNGGEKGVVFKDRDDLYWSEVLMAFYSLSDYERKRVEYSDLDDLVDIVAYDMDLDLRNPKSKVGLRARIQMTGLKDGITTIPFALGESLGRWESERLKKQLRVSGVVLNGTAVDFVQEDWEGGFTVFLPAPIRRGQAIELEVTMSGDFMEQPELGTTADFSYPRSTTSWYPRHGDLDRSTYKFTFTHSKRLKVVCVGERVAEAVSPENKDLVVTKYQMDHAIGLATFALGPFVRHKEVAKWDGTEEILPLEFNSIGTFPVKESFILAELSNSVRYFHKLFGKYPYKAYAASFHPYSFGQGFPSMLMIPPTDRANKSTYSFIAHETGHQWWGNIVAWRSYRDQWLSEGFAEYSGVLYTALRDSPKAAENLIDNMRASLRNPPATAAGTGKGRLNDVGPIILGHRLSSSKTFDGYQTLVYNKGALVLRMLHFLFTDPGSGNGDAFFAMMQDFVERHRNGTASTDDFRTVANEHFIKTPIAKRYGAKNLDWFFQQWVYETHLPSYSLEYKFEPQPDGSLLLSGNIYQENVPEGFFMPLPVTLHFGGGKTAVGTVAALGPKAPFKIRLPAKPQKVELDPDSWVLSEKTSTR